MKAKPTVSIIIPCFNKGAVVEKAVASVQANPYPAKEIIVVDDGSTDLITIKSVKKLAQHNDVRVVTKPNGGLGSARNYGLDRAKGQYIFFLDHDDVIVSQFLETAVEFMDQHRDVAYGYPQVIFFGERQGLKKPGPCSFERLRVANYIVASCIHRRDIIQRYRFDEALTVFEDWDLLLRLAQDGIVGAELPEPCFFLYRISGNSMIGQYNSFAKRYRASQAIRRQREIVLSPREAITDIILTLLYPFARPLVEHREKAALAQLCHRQPWLKKELTNLTS